MPTKLQEHRVATMMIVAQMAIVIRTAVLLPDIDILPTEEGMSGQPSRWTDTPS